MKRQRLALLALILSGAFFFSNIFNISISTNKFSQSYPAVVCPPNTPGLATAISLSSQKSLIRKTGTSSMQPFPVGLTRYAISAQSAVIEAAEVTPVVWQVRKGVWAGSVPCAAPSSSQWFVGATADISSKGSLRIVNSGLGRAMVDINVYTENGLMTPRTISMKANTYISIGLPSLAPGSQRIAIHLVPRSGRVNGFVVDERGKGLQNLGGDLVNSTGDPTKKIQIPAIPHPEGKSSGTPHVLRLLVPGDIDARINAEIRTSDGTFSPIGINGKIIRHSKVVEIPLDFPMQSGTFALSIESDQPILGSVFSKTQANGKNDFVWSTAADNLAEYTVATTGLSPNLFFTGGSIKVSLGLTFTNGKKTTVLITGEDIASYKTPDRVKSISFSRISSGTSGAALISSKSGYGYIPLNQGSVLTKSSVPASNIRVLNP